MAEIAQQFELSEVVDETMEGIRTCLRILGKKAAEVVGVMLADNEGDNTDDDTAKVRYCPHGLRATCSICKHYPL